MTKKYPQFESCILDFDGVIADTVGAHTKARSQALFKSLVIVLLMISKKRRIATGHILKKL
jgi:beta-phosphoglucomutase-like phosphatase (HAD superfamily)